MEELICKNCGPTTDYYTELKSNQNTAWCGKCNAYIKNIPYKKLALYVGKYKEVPIEEIEDIPYLKWALEKMTLKPKIKEAISQRISQFENLAR